MMYTFNTVFLQGQSTGEGGGGGGDYQFIFRLIYYLYQAKHPFNVFQMCGYKNSRFCT